MTVDGAFEQKSIIERAKAYLVGGRVYDSVPDDAVLERTANGGLRPYLTVSFGSAYAITDASERSIMGEEEQPHILPIRIQAWAGSSAAARATAGAVREEFVGWTPSPGSSQIRSAGAGSNFDNRAAGAAPTRFTERVLLETTINLGSNDGFVPSPGNMESGGAPLQGVMDLIAAALAVHIADETPHPVYDDLPDLTLIFENRLI